MFDFSRLASWSTWMCRHWVDARQLLQCHHLTSHQRDQGQRQTGHGCFEPNVPSQGPGPDATQVLFLCDKKYKSVKQHVENTWPRLWKSSWKSPYLEDFRAGSKHKCIILHWCHLQIHIRNPKNLHFSIKKTQRLSKARKGWGNPNLQHHRIQVHLRFPVRRKHWNGSIFQIPRNLDGPHQNKLNYIKIIPRLTLTLMVSPCHDRDFTSGFSNPAPDPWAPESLRHQHSSRQ